MLRPSFKVLLAALVAVALTPLLTVSAQQGRPVQVLERIATGGNLQRPALVVRPRMADLEQAGRRGSDVQISLPGVDVIARLRHFEAQGRGFFAAGPIVATSAAGRPIDGDMSFTVVGDILVGRIVFDGRLFRIGRLANSSFHELVEVDLDAMPRDGDPIEVAGGTPPVSRSAAATVEDSNALVDLLVVYTPSARVTLGGTAQIQAEAIAAVNNANLALSNSAVVHRYRLVYLGEVGYTESGTSSTDLSRLRSVSDGYMDEVHGLRDTYKADVVSLLTNATDVCGVGYLMGPSSVSTFFHTSAFNVTIALGCANGNLSLAHEVGHNIGLQHDRPNAGSLPAFDYAYGYTVPGFARTVMAYDCATGGTCPRLAVFSSPNVPFPGSAVVAGTPTENNAAALNLTSVPAANFRNSACSFVLSSNAIVVGPDGGSGSVTVTTASGCGWNSVSSDTSVATITSGSSSSGSGGASYAVGPSGVARFATLTVAGQSVSITQQASGPGAFSKLSPPNGSTGQSTIPTLSWGASSGATSYEYCRDTVNNNICDTTWTSTGTSTTVGLVALNLNTAYYWHVRALSVNGTTYAEDSATAFWSFSTGAAVPAFGQVDTPVQNAAGVQGAIGVTGWSLDNVGVATVQVFRNCFAFELQANCQTVLGNSVVYIGDAAFLDGARPDVAAAFPNYPMNTRAGWGYLMLTPLLPHVPNAQAYGGQGPLTLYAVATDIEGNRTLLGRSSNPASTEYATPTLITMANDSIAKPFGAIDTPGQGETISGIFNNFGWAITPDMNAIVDGTDIRIPANGSTMTVFIDGLPVSLVAYNQCRGTVGNPVPTGVYCNDDVSNIFGNPSPQPPTTTRTSNPTLFRNLDSASAPIGAYTFDTSTLTDGLHTIAWSVSDSAGRNEGIGSRFFNVLNAVPGAARDAALRAAPARVVGPTAMLGRHRVGTGGVWGRTGFDMETAWIAMRANATRTYTVRLPELGRLELWLGAPVDAGYLVAGGTLQPLPTGSSLAGAQFAWMPPAGYAGAYELAFLRRGERITVIVTVGRPLHVTRR